MAQGPDGPRSTLPDKPSIVVLPFENLSNDPAQGFFSDGITNDIITELYRYTDLVVIASSSAFHYKGKEIVAGKVAEELGVRYVLEGSVQKVDSKVRINVQFLDAKSGEHLWAERHDRELRGILAIQEEIAEKVAATLGAYEGAVAQADLARAKGKAAISLDAYELVLIAREQRHKFNKEDNARSVRLLQKAVTLEPQYTRAYVGLAWSHAQDFWNAFVDTPRASLQLALESAIKAVELDPTFAEAHWVLADVYLSMGKLDKGVAAFRRALELNPNHADMLADWGGAVLPDVLGKPEEGIETVKRAMRLSPHHADWYDRALMGAYFEARRYEDAITAFANVKYPTMISRKTLAASYAYTGQPDKASAATARILESDPTSRVSDFIPSYTNTPAKHLREGLRLAGLPE